LWEVVSGEDGVVTESWGLRGAVGFRWATGCPPGLYANGADGAEFVGEPEDDFESDRRAWVPFAEVPDLIGAGEIRSGSTVAALLLLHHRRLFPDACEPPAP
jgi:hypothetical protein